MVIVDTNIWSAFLRRSIEMPAIAVDEFKNLVSKNQVVLLGIVKQELLSGIKHKRQFKRIEDILEGFPSLLATSEDHVFASHLYNSCRKHGIQGSHIDFLICAQAINNHHEILTTDGDFTHYEKVIPIDLIPLNKL